jgi:hypothetical protein
MGIDLMQLINRVELSGYDLSGMEEDHIFSSLSHQSDPKGLGAFAYCPFGHSQLPGGFGNPKTCLQTLL